MGLAVSKTELLQDDIGAPKELTLERGAPGAIKPSTRTSNRLRFEDCFGLDESQSRSTESTQGSPEIDMYPSKATRGSRRASGSSSGVPSFGRPKWFRKQSTGSVGAKDSHKNDSIPPSFLVIKQSAKKHGSLPALASSSTATSCKTAPVPVQTPKTHSINTMDGWGWQSDGGTGDSEARMDELQRMYDMRTWDMYLRITEARKNMPTPTMIPHHHHTTPQPLHSNDGYDYFTPGDEPFDENESAVDISQSEEMIFGDLE